jgi:hypothetical protein
MIRDRSLDDAEIDVVFEVLPRPHFIITFSPFPDEPDCFVECELPDLIWQVVCDKIDAGEDPRTLSNWLRMLSYEIDGAV